MTYITGPTHNLLGLAFRKRGGSGLEIEARPAVGGCEHAPIQEDLLAQAVNDGLQDAASEIGVVLQARKIVYVMDDTPAYRIYRHCAKLIACQVAGGGRPGGSLAD